MPENPTHEDWKNIIRKSNWKYALRLLALAYLDSNREEDCNLESMEVLCERLEFNYQGFTQHRIKLEEQLTFYNVSLLKRRDGKNQYLRTIQKYSGKMYVRIAKKLSEKVHGWDESQLDVFLDSIKFEFCSAKNMNDDACEANDAFNDAKIFFQKIGQKYREWNRPPDREDLEQLEEARSLTSNVLNKLYETLFPPPDSAGNSMQETRPQVCAGADGSAMFSLPAEGIFEDKFKQVGHVAFCFKKMENPEETYTLVSYDWNGNKWEKRNDHRPLKIGLISKVLMCWRDADNNQIQFMDVTPELTHQTFILWDVAENKPCSYRHLKTGKTYQILPLKMLPEVLCRSFEEEQFETIAYDNQNRFSIAEGTEIVKIGETEYNVGQMAFDWLDTEKSVCIADRAGNRLFFQKEKSPLLNTDNLSLRYGDRDLPSEPWDPPTWENESLEILRNGRRILKYPLTFIDPIEIRVSNTEDFIPWEDFQEEKIPLGKSGSLEVSLNGEIRKLEYNEDQLSVQFKYKFFTLDLKLPRVGICLETPNHVKIPILPQMPHDDSHILELAREDYECCSCQLLNFGGSVLYARGNAFKEIESPSFSFYRLEASSQKNLWEQSNYCSFLPANGNYQTVYRFHIYDPIHEFIPLETVLPGAEKKTNRKFAIIFDLPNEKSDDLTLFFFISAYSVDRPKYLVYYPAHRQDQPSIEISADESSWSRDEKGRFIQKLVFKNFYNRSDIDWGKGLLCFIATKLTYANGISSYRVVSSGFFLGPKPGKDTEISDDPHGLRRAMAGRDVAKIREIMTSDNQEIRLYTASFIENMTRAMAPLNAYPYLNSYWNKLTNNDGEQAEKENGYIFLAGWYFSEGGNGYDSKKNELTDDFSPYWDSLLVSYDYLKDLNPGGSEQILQQLAFGYGIQPFSENSISAILQLMKLFGIKPSLDNQKECSFSRKIFFTYPQLSEMAKKYVENDQTLPEEIENLLEPLCDLWKQYKAADDAGKNAILNEIEQAGQKGICYTHNRKPWFYGEAVYHERLCNDRAPYLFYPGYRMDMNNPDLWKYTEKINIGFSKESLLKLLDAISARLHEWRKNPTLTGAQNLRSALIRLRDVDSEMGLLGANYFPLREYIRVKTLFFNQNDSKQKDI